MTEKVCKECGTVAEPVAITKGSLGTEIVLWLFFLIPGIFYTAWRHGTRHDGCPKCSSASLVPLDTPMGRELAKDYKPARPEPARPPRAGAVAFGRALGRLFAKK